MTPKSGTAAFDLDRFVTAQAPIYARVLEELRAGRKTSHWMWFIFPQLRGLGLSDMAQYYGLDGRAEAAAYLDHPLLGEHLRECTAIVNGLERVSAHEVFGMPDTLKFRSSMTIFDLVAEPASVFAEALDKYFHGERDARTIALVRP
ncbi:MAG TPA: DUF1810 domain-containing protein [Vicinamibacterales bacterium]|jgi:uncharacterized protein (DUF1810 family)|nr:DUF1810 domain-containing protein [Vicinamibacterales bacterium]